VRHEGGVVFAGLAEKAWRGGDEEAAEAAYELAWEELHSGPWKSVPLVWRDAYSLSCLALASCHHRANRHVEALKVLDLGVIMGGPRFRKEIDSSLHSISLASSGIARSLESHNSVNQESLLQVASPDMHDVYLRKKKEEQMLHEVNKTSFFYPYFLFTFAGVLMWTRARHCFSCIFTIRKSGEKKMHQVCHVDFF
jgi:hypothetical protein